MITSVVGFLAILIAMGLFVLAIIFILVPIVKGGFAFGALIGRLIRHIFRWFFGSISDIIRIVGQLLGMIVLVPTLLGSIVLGRWTATQQAWSVIKGNALGITLATYRLFIRRPMALLGISAALDDVERSFREGVVPATAGSTDGFEGYRIIDTLTSGGSGAALYVAEPMSARRRRLDGQPSRVVIKCFDLQGGSMLPQMMRESRSLDSARRLGLVLEHDMDTTRFWYVMPWIPGVHLGNVINELHAGGRGLDETGLSRIITVTLDLLQALRRYHRQGLWHKDVKPENIIVNESGAHLVDLGLVTPLASAMTLTTHGTEYFRDPELVRQALRGAKVSEVDGARFDVYAAGAVLYYMLENTFPAHGGLSRFDQPSPEAAQWIVRRSMSEYEQRYSTIGMMLEDVAVLAKAADPWSVRPADLPSMRGTAAVRTPVVTAPPPRPRPRHQPPQPPPSLRFTNRPASPPPPPLITRRKSAGGQFAWLSAVASFVLGVGILVLVGQLVRTPSSEGMDPFGSPLAVANQIEVPSPASSRPGLCLVIVDHPSRDTADVADSIEVFSGQLTRAGWTQRVDVEAEIAIRSVMPPRLGPGREPVHPAVRLALQDRDLDAAVVLVEGTEEGEIIDVIMLTREWQARWSLPHRADRLSEGEDVQE